MALLKNKRSLIGIDGDYWRIVAVETRYIDAVTVVHIAQYVSKRARNEGAVPLETKRIVLDGETNGMPVDDPAFHKNPDFLPEPTRANAYTALKQTRDFLDAVDDNAAV